MHKRRAECPVIGILNEVAGISTVPRCSWTQNILLLRVKSHLFGLKNSFLCNSMKIGGNVFGPPATLRCYSCIALIACRQVLYFLHKGFQRQKLSRIFSNTNMTGCARRAFSMHKRRPGPPILAFFILSMSLRFNLIMCTQGCLFGLQLMKHFEMVKALALNCMLILKSL